MSEPEKKKPARKKFMARFDQHAPVIGIAVQREICRRVAAGESMKVIEAVEGIPAKHQIYDLIWRDPNFKRMYKDARMAQMLILAEELREVAAEAKNLKNVAEKKAMAHVQAIRLQVDTDKWLLSKLLKDEYGDDLPPAGGNRDAMSSVLDIIREVSKLAREEPKPVVKARVVVPAIEDTK